MTDSCFHKNTLAIPGTRQDERLLKALQEGYVQPDERTLADLMRFINQFAGQLVLYTYDEAGQMEYKTGGTWEPLIHNSEAFRYADIAVIPAGLPNQSFFYWAQRYENGANQQERFEGWRAMWNILFTLYHDINAIYTSLQAGMPLRAQVAGEIEQHLSADFANAVVRYIHAHRPEQVPLILAPGAPAAPGRFMLYAPTPTLQQGYPVRDPLALLQLGFDNVWVHPALGMSSHAAFMDHAATLHTEAQLSAHGSGLFMPLFYGDAAITGFDRIDYASIALRQLFDRAYRAYARIVQLAARQLDYSLQNKHNHEPHHALLLCFLHLLQPLQQAMNAFTWRHLQFYYTRILRMQAPQARPDAVHLLAELTKGIAHARVPQGSLLPAGKDANGAALLYATQQELVAGQAMVAQVKTMLQQSTPGANDLQALYAAPDARLHDGQTGDPVPHFAALNDMRRLATIDASGRGTAPGWAIAANVLHLTAGKRIIRLTFTTHAAGWTKVAAWSTGILKSLLRCAYTAPEGWQWLDLHAPETEFAWSVVSAPLFKFEIKVTLPEALPPFVGGHPELHTGIPYTRLPVLLWCIAQEAGTPLTLWDGVHIDALQVLVEVQKMTNLALNTQAGRVNAGAPFAPFGPIPVLGSSFYAGHPELAHKDLYDVKLHFSWQDFKANLLTHYQYRRVATPTTTPYIPIAGNASFQVDMHLLRKKSWRSLGSGLGILNAAEQDVVQTTGAVADAVLPADYLEEATPWSAASAEGFVRCRLTAPAEAFGHAAYPAVLTQQTIAFHSNQTANSIPNPPYTPVAAAVSLSYKATQEIGTNADRGSFFALYPFGSRPQAWPAPLLPLYHLIVKLPDNTFEPHKATGICFAGLTGTHPGSTLHLLLQLSEGTEDISIDPAEVHWNYLSIHGWKSLEGYLLSNDTGSYSRAGVVQCTVPADAQLGATELPAGMFWIAIFTTTNGAGLPQLTALHTNAVKAVLHSQSTDEAHYKLGLQPGTITRMEQPVAGIKKWIQPYKSFGGSAPLALSLFYRQVSERLRHKARAVTIWDYEQLILNAFEEVYLVKCLNHTGYACGCGSAEAPAYRENIPGQVMLVPLPYAGKVQSSNPFQPRFSTAMLRRIHEFIRGTEDDLECGTPLSALHTRLAKLHVENPVYELITITCYVQIKPCSDPFFYKQQLHTDLNLLLAPWLDGESSRLQLGGSLHLSMVVQYMEELPYVAHVEQVQLLHTSTEGAVLNSTQPQWAVTTTSRSILTTSDTHQIILLNT